MEVRTDTILDIPSRPDHLIGRESLLETIIDRLSDRHQKILAIWGPPGIGKTTLAIHISYNPKILKRYPDGILWARLGVGSPIPLIQARWATALGRDLSRYGNYDDRCRVLNHWIRDRSFLFVIDNLADVDSLQYLQCGGPKSGYLVITREESLAARISGGNRVVQLSELDDDAIQELIVQYFPDFRLIAEENRLVLTSLSHGNPLAAKILAGCLRESKQVEQCIQQIKTRSRDITDLEQSLLAIISSSIEILPGKIQQKYFNLGVFAPEPESFSEEAAQFITGLNQKSLVNLHQHNLIDRAGKSITVTQPVADLLIQYTPPESFEKFNEYYSKRIRDRSFDLVEFAHSYGQIKSMLQRMGDNEERLDLLLALSGRMGEFGLWEDMIDWGIQSLSAAVHRERNHELGMLCNLLGKSYSVTGEKAVAAEYYELALTALEKSQDESSLAVTLNNLGVISTLLDRPEEAVKYLQRAVDICEKIGNQDVLANSLNNLGKVYADAGNPKQALGYYQRALPIFIASGNKEGECTIRSNLAIVHWNLDSLREAEEELRKAITLEKELGIPGVDRDEALLDEIHRTLSTPRILRWIWPFD
jgi:tetratricopeptide (TPR) repeat protein